MRHQTAAMTRSDAATIIILLLFGIVLALYAIIRFTPPPPPQTVLVENSINGKYAGNWTDTFLDVKAPATILAGGSVFQPDIFLDSSPDGVLPEGSFLSTSSLGYERTYRHFIPDFPLYSLVGRINTGTPFFVGAEAIIKESGRLYLAVNGFYSDRSGGGRHGMEVTGNFSFKLVPFEKTSKNQFISSKQQWQQTAFNPGDKISVIGFANSRSGYYDSQSRVDGLFLPVAPAGWTIPVPDVVTLSKRLAPNCPYMSLVARFGTDKVFCIGRGSTLPRSSPGTVVFMAVNDIFWDRFGNEMPNWFTENEGGFFVRTRK